MFRTAGIIYARRRDIFCLVEFTREMFGCGGYTAQRVCCCESGERSRIVELLRRFTSLNCQVHRIDAAKECGRKRKNIKYLLTSKLGMVIINTTIKLGIIAIKLVGGIFYEQGRNT